MKDSLNFLLNWYKAQCNGQWEKTRGISIETIDNPGWFIIINLSGTDCEGKFFDKIKYEIDEMNWYICYVKDGIFEGACGPNNLSTVLQIFHKWSIS
jgi:hypothetical protein